MKVEVEGYVIGGVLIANVVKLRGGDNKVYGSVSTPVLNNQFEVLVDSDDNETVTVIVSAETEVEDDINEAQFFSIGDLIVGNFVEVRGFADASNNVTATQVKLTDEDDYLVQGVITELNGNASSGFVTVLGVPFEYTGGADATEFDDEVDDPTGLTFTEFETLVTPQLGQVTVKIKDKIDAINNTPVGVADEIEIELP